MNSVGKAPHAFGLGRNMGGSLPAAQPFAIVAGRRGVQAGSLIYSRQRLSPCGSSDDRHLFLRDSLIKVGVGLNVWGEYLCVFAQVSGEGVARPSANALHGFKRHAPQ